VDCVLHGQSRCDIRGLSAQQIRRIGAHHQRAEQELDVAEEELERASAKVRRLRKQKKMWLDKMMRAVSRGIDSVEELERVEREEAEEAAQKQATPSAASSSELVFSEIEIDPVFLQEGVELSPSWFVGMGVSGPGDIAEQAADNSSSA
jgi:pyruvate/2-oxoglutarate dehydrogenase complex dihydrolipoamide acyltransferase (E2) component